MDNIGHFWSEFSKVESRLKGENPSVEAMEYLLTVLEEIDPRLYYHLGSKDEGTDLILSAEGYADLMPILEKLRAAAPKLPDWDVRTSYEGMLLFGERNERVFPLNQNGDVLYRMACNGDHLWIARDVDFQLIFPTKENATSFLSNVERDGMRCEFDEYDGAEGFTCQVEVTTCIVPTCKAITETENFLGRLAEKFGGRNDGWGCFEIHA